VVTYSTATKCECSYIIK